MTPQREDFRQPSLLQQFEKALAELAEATETEKLERLARDLASERRYRAEMRVNEISKNVALLSAALTQKALKGGK